MTNKQPVKDLQAPLKELHKLFNKANEELYGGSLPNVVITIQSKGKTNSLGWFTINPAWVVGDDSELHEINMSSESLKREFNEIAKTLLHEMVHLHCHVNEIKDVSRNYTYHNKRFKEQSELHGLKYKYDAPDPKIGYSAMQLTLETIEKIDTWGIDKEVFQLARKEFGNVAPKKKSNVIKWHCPKCGDIVRSSKPTVKIICANDNDGTTEPCYTFFERG